MSTALVLLMTPAAAFFYGGLVRAKNALNTMMMCVGALAIVGVLWPLIGYTLAFSGSTRWVGGWRYLLLNGLGIEARGTIPHGWAVAFQASTATLPAALLSEPNGA